MEKIDLINFTKKLCSDLPCFIVSANELTNNIFPEKCCIISNTEASWKKGKHWVSFYYKPKMTVEFFDSFANKPGYYSHYFVKFLNSKKMSHYIQNKVEIQGKYSNICGLYCLLFYWSKVTNISFENFLQMFDYSAFEKNDTNCLHWVESIYNYHFVVQNDFLE